jgi:S1-C subfamily serine protease
MNRARPEPAISHPSAFVARLPRLRTVAAGLAASVALLGVAGVPAVASAATPTSGTVSPADWSQGGWYGGGGWGGSGGYPGDGSNGGAAAVDSKAATSAESRGVVLIDTVLSYEGAAAAGTGVIISSSGQVLTNYHVVEGATKITVTVASSGKTYRATVVGHDETRDVALLQLDDASGLDTVKIDDDTVAVGDDVTAVGNAGGAGTLSATAGSVTSLTATVTTAAEGTVDSETLTSMIETDADVVAGDSGGPLYDDQGEVIGIDTAASTGAEIDGYAIPIAEALKIVDQIRSGDNTSTVRIGPAAFLGVLLSDDSSTTYGSQGSDDGFFGTYEDTSGTEGATIGGVVDGSPAAKAGLEAGDTITKVGSHTVATADEVSGLLAKHKVGDKVTIHWIGGDGTSHSANVTLAASPVA